MSTPLLSILIATLAHREGKFLRLMDQLLPQVDACPWPVEVVALQNEGEYTLAEYREALLRDARGTYLCFVDDDDEVSPQYVQLIAEALQHSPDVVGWQHLNTGTPGVVTDVSIANRGKPSHAVEGVYYRCFTHMNPVRTDLARRGTFLSGLPGHTGEDMVFVNSVLPHLKREVQLPRAVYVYRWDYTDTTQAGPQPEYRRVMFDGHPRPQISSPHFRWCTWPFL